MAPVFQRYSSLIRPQLSKLGCLEFNTTRGDHPIVTKHALEIKAVNLPICMEKLGLNFEAKGCLKARGVGRWKMEDEQWEMEDGRQK